MVFKPVKVSVFVGSILAVGILLWLAAIGLLHAKMTAELKRSITEADEFKKGEAYDNYRAWRQGLLNIGYFKAKIIPLANAETNSEEARRLLNVLNGQNIVHFEIGNDWSEITLIGRNEDLRTWSSRLKEMDDFGSTNIRSLRPEETTAISEVDLDKIVLSWRDLPGARLPSKADITNFTQNVSSGTVALTRAIDSPAKKVRLGAAYVISEIGQPYRGLGPKLRSAYGSEEDVISKIYIIRGLTALREENLDTKTFFLNRFRGAENLRIKNYAAVVLATEYGDETAREWIRSEAQLPAVIPESSEFWEAKISFVDGMSLLGVASDLITEGFAPFINDPRVPPWVQSQIKYRLDRVSSDEL